MLRSSRRRPLSGYDSLNEFEFDEVVDSDHHQPRQHHHEVASVDAPTQAATKYSHTADPHKSWPYTNYVADEVPPDDASTYRRPAAAQPVTPFVSSERRIASWWTEILSICISIGSFVGMIATLASYNGRTISGWRLPVTINAVVSILSTAFKSSMVLPVAEGISQLKWVWFASGERSLSDMETFDMASRGPWGSSLLLFNQVVRSDGSILATLGAILIILVLAVDPFTQALIQYYPCLQPSQALRASIPRANSYTAFANHFSAGRVTLDGPMQLALFQGVLSPPLNSSAAVSVDCTSGNCTFPSVPAAAAAADPAAASSFSTLSTSTSQSDTGSSGAAPGKLATFSTLAFCPVCDDVTALVVNDTAPNSTVKGAYNYSLPSGARIYGATVSVAETPLLSTVDMKKFSFTGFDALMMRYQPGCTSAQPEAVCPMGPFAVRCALQPCVNTYAANVTAGIYDETLLSSAALVRRSTDPTYSLVLRGAALYNGTWAKCDASPTQTESHPIPVDEQTMTVRALTSLQQSTPPVPPAPPAGGDVAYYPAHCAYLLGANAILGISSFMSDSLFSGRNLSIPYGLARASINNGPTWLQTLWHNGSASLATAQTFMDGLAAAASAQLRLNSNDSSPETRRVRGQLWVNETCIQVRWAYISFSATLLCLALVFFVSVLLAGRRADGGSAYWKSSPLALLFAGVDDTASIVSSNRGGGSVGVEKGGARPSTVGEPGSPVGISPGAGDEEKRTQGGEDMADFLIRARTMKVRLKRESTGGWRFGMS
ncbi:uncharacterized protein E0L32_011751 [Thyridium curvatum]|uniref:Uncharacterized protein n=1 Tax=Thyridium curvatum TaxID=1093900 RepID=A0A507BNK8_9PEZI|nr:uncharacterized protein E0L32_011751 [Thyridium curvatum]TPX18340.1 hypothetical protein E0L32_011751 [Thyridium curvatum]